MLRPAPVPSPPVRGDGGLSSSDLLDRMVVMHQVLLEGRGPPNITSCSKPTAMMKRLHDDMLASQPWQR